MNRKTVLMALAGLAMASSAVAQTSDASKAYAAELNADAATKTSLLAAANESGELELDLSAVSAIDLALLQMLISTQKTIGSKGGTMKIVDSRAGAVKLALAAAGLPPLEEVQA